MNAQHRRIGLPGIVFAVSVIIAAPAHTVECAVHQDTIRRLNDASIHDFTKALEIAGIAREVAVVAKRGNITRADLDAINATNAALNSMTAHNANFERVLDALNRTHRLVISEWAAGTFDKSERYGSLMDALTKTAEAAAETIKSRDNMHHRAAVAMHRVMYAATCR